MLSRFPRASVVTTNFFYNSGSPISLHDGGSGKKKSYKLVIAEEQQTYLAWFYLDEVSLKRARALPPPGW